MCIRDRLSSIATNNSPNVAAVSFDQQEHAALRYVVLAVQVPQCYGSFTAVILVADT